MWPLPARILLGAAVEVMIVLIGQIGGASLSTALAAIQANADSLSSASPSSGSI
jgi:hypothetical protein